VRRKATRQTPNSLVSASHRDLRAGHVTEWTPQEPRRPCRLRVQIAGLGVGLLNLDELGAPTDFVMTNGRSAVPPSEGNEVRRDGWQGVGASRSTDEVGEPDRRDPAEGRARLIMDLL